MGDNLSTIVYVLIGIIVLVFKAINKTKKTGIVNDNTSSVMKNALEKIMEENAQYDEIIKSNVENKEDTIDVYSNTFDEDKAEHINTEPEPEPVILKETDDIELYDDSTNDNFDLKQAIISSEIINRKYF